MPTVGYAHTCTYAHTIGRNKFPIPSKLRKQIIRVIEAEATDFLLGSMF